MTGTADPFDLSRFVRAQEGVYEEALAEIRGGRKRSHWIWFIFPQIAGLGVSSTSQHYADEAQAYLQHPVLGPRLIECSEALLAVQGRSAHNVFGSPDDMKVRSCATLFELVAPNDSVFSKVLERYYRGERDERTLRLLALPAGREKR